MKTKIKTGSSLHEADGRLEVVEYWPGFVDRSEPRRTIVRSLAEVEGIPWLREKGEIVVEGSYVKWLAGGFVAATIRECGGGRKPPNDPSSPTPGQ